MDRIRIDGGELEYEITGEGEPTLLIHGAHLAEAMAPLVDTAALEGCQMIRYHRRGYAGSAHPAPVSIADHAEDAAALVEQLGHDRVHVIGHSSGAVIALELAARHPRRVRSLALLEPAVLFGPAGAAFAEVVAPLVERYGTGDATGAVEGFLALIGSDRWRDTIEDAIPGAIDQAIEDAATFFERELPAAGAWRFGRDRASAIDCPVLSVLGTASGPFFEEGRRRLHEWFDRCVDADLPGVSHLLQVEASGAVATAVAAFLTATSELAPRHQTEAAAG
jgi:pimeloyl-ACP methyl ester carboxylesterase